jgi:hypothetical protein
VKLSTAMVKRTLDQFEALALPENHPAIATLSKVFGEHTFFIDDKGINIVQPAIRYDTGTELGQVVKLASWEDAACTSLKPHEPEPTGVMVPFTTDNNRESKP